MDKMTTARLKVAPKIHKLALNDIDYIQNELDIDIEDTDINLGQNSRLDTGHTQVRANSRYNSPGNDTRSRNLPNRTKSK